MAIKIAYLLLAAIWSCLDGGFGGAADPSGIDPGIRLGLTSPSRDDPVPKIEPLALTRPGFNTIGAGPRSFDPDSRRPGPVNAPMGRFGVQVRADPGRYIRRNLPPGGINRPLIQGSGRYVPGNSPGVVRYPTDLRPGGPHPGNLPPGGINRPLIPGPGQYVPGNSPGVVRYPTDLRPGGPHPGNLPPGGINRPLIPGPGQYVPGNSPGVVRYPVDLRPGGPHPGNLPPGGINTPFVTGPNNIPENLPLRRYPFNPGWNQRGHDQFRLPVVNPSNHDQRQFGRNGPGVNGPICWIPRMLPGQGDIIGQKRPGFNPVIHRSIDDSDNEKDVPKGTVVVTVAAVNETDKGSIHANVTISVVPKEGDNKEPLKLGTKEHLSAAQSILNEMFNEHKGEEQKSKASSNLEDVVNKLDLPKH